MARKCNPSRTSGAGICRRHMVHHCSLRSCIHSCFCDLNNPEPLRSSPSPLQMHSSPRYPTPPRILSRCFQALQNQSHLVLYHYLDCARLDPPIPPDSSLLSAVPNFPVGPCLSNLGPDLCLGGLYFRSNSLGALDWPLGSKSLAPVCHGELRRSAVRPAVYLFQPDRQTSSPSLHLRLRLPRVAEAGYHLDSPACYFTKAPQASRGLACST